MVDALTRAVAQACGAILAQGRCQARYKHDGSPVTNADHASEAVLLAALPQVLPGVPVVSEEKAYAKRLPARLGTLVLVDPLDGTREFLSGSAEFTVNLALVTDRRPVLGIVGAPALGLLWRGVVGKGAERLSLREGAAETAAEVRPRRWPKRSAARAFISRSHLDEKSAALLARHPEIETEPCGSSLKFCRLAQGEGDLYPRLAPTSEWDIAAGHAILAAAGGAMARPDGSPLSYGDAAAGFCVPAFVALGDPAALPRVLPEARFTG